MQVYLRHFRMDKEGTHKMKPSSEAHENINPDVLDRALRDMVNAALKIGGNDGKQIENGRVR